MNDDAFFAKLEGLLGRKLTKTERKIAWQAVELYRQESQKWATPPLLLPPKDSGLPAAKQQKVKLATKVFPGKPKKQLEEEKLAELYRLVEQNAKKLAGQPAQAKVPAPDGKLSLEQAKKLYPNVFGNLTLAAGDTVQWTQTVTISED